MNATNRRDCLDKESGAEENLSHLARLIKEDKLHTVPIYSNFDEKEADVLRKGLKNTASITQLDLANNIQPTILKAALEGLKYNKTIKIITYREYGDLWQNGSQQMLQKIFSIPRIRYKITLIEGSPILEMIDRECANYIKYLNVIVESAELDDLLYRLRDNKVLDTMEVDLKQHGSMCKRLSLFGNFKQLTSLKIRILSNDFKQLFAALEKTTSLVTLNLSNSIITTDSARQLADLIQKLPNLNSLDLSFCQIGNDEFNIICEGILHNNTIMSLNVLDNPFDRLDLTIDQKLTNRRKINQLETSVFDENMAKLFDVENLSFYGEKFDGFKGAKIRDLTISQKLTQVQQITDLFNALTDARYIYSLKLKSVPNEEASRELCKNLAVNKTLKRIDIGYLHFEEKGLTSFKILCDMIKTNNTLETFLHDGNFSQISYRDTDNSFPYFLLLEALKKNTSLTTVDFLQLKCAEWEVEEVLKAKPYLTFTRLADQKSGSNASILNARNKKNISRRLSDAKCNVVTLARSYLSDLVPFELWLLILEQIHLSDVDFVDLFQRSLRK